MSEVEKKKNIYEYLKEERKTNQESMINRLRPYMDKEMRLHQEILLSHCNDFNFDLQMYYKSNGKKGT